MRVLWWFFGTVLVLVVSAFLLLTYQQADHLVHHPLQTRTPAKHQPQDFDLQVTELVLI